MNPSLPIPELFTLPTITLMITITFIMQGSVIAFNSRSVREYKGVTEAFLATLALALGFAVLLIRQYFPDYVIGLLTNSFVITGHVLIYIAVSRFIEKPLNHYLMRWLVPLGYLALVVLTFLPRGILPLSIIVQFISFQLNFAAALALLRTDRGRFKIGIYLTAFPLLTYGIITLIRMVIGIISPREVLPGPSLSNIFDVLSLYVLSYLWTSGFILMISQRLQSDLNDLAMNDALTRVKNRRAMQGMLDFEMRRIQNEIKDFSIILLDVDHFKQVNDTYGHDIGDLVLQWMVQSLQAQLRVHDIIARWGGEEFLILLPDTSLDEALETAERLRLAVEKSTIEGTPTQLHVTFSGGVATSKTNRNVNQLCKIADQALYIAKQTRNRIVSQDEVPAS